MTGTEPLTALDAAFSDDEAVATSWSEARRELETAEIFWLTTVRPGGRPHVTPLIAVWRDDAMYFVTGPEERKARNLAANAHCVLTTGRNALGEGLDLVVEGEAVRVRDGGALERVAAAYEAKYGPVFTSPEGTFHGLADTIRGGDALVYEVAPAKVLGFAKGKPFGQTRWTF